MLASHRKRLIFIAPCSRKRPQAGLISHPHRELHRPLMICFRDPSAVYKRSFQNESHRLSNFTVNSLSRLKFATKPKSRILRSTSQKSKLGTNRKLKRSARITQARLRNCMNASRKLTNFSAPEASAWPKVKQKRLNSGTD